MESNDDDEDGHLEGDDGIMEFDGLTIGHDITKDHK
jgi:hypothetical protein